MSFTLNLCYYFSISDWSGWKKKKKKKRKEKKKE
jgi:hypothetical protein